MQKGLKSFPLAPLVVVILCCSILAGRQDASAQSLRYFSISDDGSLYSVIYDHRTSNSTLSVRHGNQRSELRFCGSAVEAYLKFPGGNAFAVSESRLGSGIAHSGKFQILEQMGASFRRVADMDGPVASVWLDERSEELIIHTDAINDMRQARYRYSYFAVFDGQNMKMGRFDSNFSAAGTYFADLGAIRLSSDSLIFSSSKQQIGTVFHKSALPPFIYEFDLGTGHIRPSNWLIDRDENHQVHELAPDIAAQQLTHAGLYFALWSNKAGWGRQVTEATTLRFQGKCASASKVIGNFSGIWRRFTMSPNKRFVAAEIYRLTHSGLAVPIEDNEATIAIFDLDSPNAVKQTPKPILPMKMAYHTAAASQVDCVRVFDNVRSLR
jgi:hypothetical protein